jgi:hypothetical protein
MQWFWRTFLVAWGLGNGWFRAIYGELTQRALQTHEGFEAHNKSIRFSDSTSQPEELVYGAVVNSQALHPELGLLLGMEEASASTVSALTASSLIFAYDFSLI